MAESEFTVIETGEIPSVLQIRKFSDGVGLPFWMAQIFDLESGELLGSVALDINQMGDLMMFTTTEHVEELKRAERRIAAHNQMAGEEPPC